MKRISTDSNELADVPVPLSAENHRRTILVAVLATQGTELSGPILLTVQTFYHLIKVKQVYLKQICSLVVFFLKLWLSLHIIVGWGVRA